MYSIHRAFSPSSTSLEGSTSGSVIEDNVVLLATEIWLLWLQPWTASHVANYPVDGKH